MVTRLPWQLQCYVNNSFVLSPVEVIFFFVLFVLFCVSLCVCVCVGGGGGGEGR